MKTTKWYKSFVLKCKLNTFENIRQIATKIKKENINEFDLEFTVYNIENKYTLEQINDMFIEWAKSKDLYVGGVVKDHETKTT